MSLNWNLEGIRDHEELLVGEGDERRLDALTESFIWQSMVTGLGKDWTLDAEFAPEFYGRLKIIERMSGPLVRRTNAETGKVEDYWITPEDVERRIGLHTNVSPVSRAAFVKAMVTTDLERAVRGYNATIRSQEKEATAA